MDKERLTKLMALTTSDNDGEALNALRMANKMLMAERLTWEEILGETRQQISISIHRQPMNGSYEAPEDWTPPHLKDKATLDHIFRTIYAKLGPSESGFKEFIDSVHKWYRARGFVTQAQYHALRRAYGRVSK